MGDVRKMNATVCPSVMFAKCMLRWCVSWGLCELRGCETCLMGMYAANRENDRPDGANRPGDGTTDVAPWPMGSWGAKTYGCIDKSWHATTQYASASQRDPGQRDDARRFIVWSEDIGWRWSVCSRYDFVEILGDAASVAFLFLQLSWKNFPISWLLGLHKTNEFHKMVGALEVCCIVT